METPEHPFDFTFTEKSKETIRSTRRFQWDEITTIRSDGVEDRWRHHDCVIPHHQSYSAEDRRQIMSGEMQVGTWCEWPITSQYREGKCSRSAAYNMFGLSLCWQHEDAAFSYVLSRLEDGHYHRGQMDRIARALFTAATEKAVGVEALDDAISRRLHALLDPAVDTKPMPYDHMLEQLIDEKLTERLQDRWGNDEN
jgi:hypothetical protein